MSFSAPWLLPALLALPLLWWFLRVTPPAPRRERFPAVRLLQDLLPTEETTARTPWWLLALRLAAAALVILGLAGPVEQAGTLVHDRGPVLLVVDNGWATAANWARRMAAANAALDRIARSGARVALLATAEGPSGAPLAISPPMPVARQRARLALLRPEPWPPDRAAAAALLRAWRSRWGPHGAVYIADRLADPGSADAAFAAALARIGPVTELAALVPAVRVLLPPQDRAGHLVARVAQLPQPVRQRATVLAEAPGGRILARFGVEIPPRAALGEAAVPLPLELTNRLSALRLGGKGAADAPSAAGVVLLDERWRRRPVGLVSGDPANANLPFVGDLYYLERALGPYAEVRQGDLAALLARKLAVIVLADRVLPPGPETTAVSNWVAGGGLLVRFAGPLFAAHPDALLPVHLIAGERALGGALTWGRPEPLARFPAASPFAGLAVPADVTVARQVLAEPDVALARHTWATLADGTPLVTAAHFGAGRIVLFHVTANTAWSNLPLSGLFVAMLRRLVELSAGVAETPGRAVLAPAEAMDGFGALQTPGPAAGGLTADRFAASQGKAAVLPSPRHPPGLYGPPNGRRALNLTAALPPLRVMPPIPGARVEALTALGRERRFGPALLAIALGLFTIDLLVALGLRGLIGWRARAGARRGAAALGLVLIWLAVPSAARAGIGATNPALVTRIAYVITGNPAVDALTREGLRGLGEFVNARTAVTLGPPKGVVPGRDDLSFYPLLYWPVTANAPALKPVAVTALNRFMGNGGIILMDTEGGGAEAAGSGAGFAPGVGAALRRVSRGLAIPPLTTLTYENVLAHTFYLLRDFPGRFDGAPVWLARDPANRNDNVSPIIVGGDNWVAAWAVDANGHHPYVSIPGGANQRLLAYRFGVNVVMYALTGNYKGDQVHLPAILQRLGQ
ncbi:MAG: DUF4159 domain-containing protein [Rhodospirillales bacterium]|nr:DUF4159 domain-containing protein [Rhodospirillales bacterium]